MDEAKLNAAHDVSTREVSVGLDNLKAIISQRIDSTEKMIDEKFRARDLALSNQATEYERRLGDLNHAHTKQVEIQQTYVQQDYYNSQHKDVTDRVSRLEKDAASNGRVDSLEAMLRDKAEALEKTMRDKAEAMERAGRQNMSSLETSLRERVEAIDRSSNQRIQSLSRIVYMMIGGLIVIQIILKFVPIGR